MPIDDAENRLRIATRAAAIGIWDWNPITNEIVYSHTAKAICGFPLDQPVTFDMVLGVTHPEDLHTTLPAAQRALDPGLRENIVYRYRIIRADNGETRHVLAYGEAGFAELDGKTIAVRYVGTLQDVTREERARAALAASEQRLTLAIASGQLAVWELDIPRNVVTPSPELNRLYGFADDAVPSVAEYQARYAPGEVERIQRRAEEVVAAGGTEIEDEIALIWPDGTRKWLLLRAQLLENAQRAIGVVVDVTRQKQAEERQQFLTHELEHRVKNVLSTVAAIAAQTFKGPALDDQRQAFQSRILTLSKAHDLLTRTQWSNAYVGEVLKVTLSSLHKEAITLSGPAVAIEAKAAQSLSLAINELATNALKYGALSTPGGGVYIDWSLADGTFSLEWRELGGPPVVPPARRGFGSLLLERMLPGDFQGTARLDYAPNGLVYRLIAPHVRPL